MWVTALFWHDHMTAPKEKNSTLFVFSHFQQMNIQSFQWLYNEAKGCRALFEHLKQNQYFHYHLTCKICVLLASVFILDAKHEVRVQRIDASAPWLKRGTPHWSTSVTSSFLDCKTERLVLCSSLWHIWVQEKFKQPCCCSRLSCVVPLHILALSHYINVTSHTWVSPPEFHTLMPDKPMWLTSSCAWLLGEEESMCLSRSTLSISLWDREKGPA